MRPCEICGTMAKRKECPFCERDVCSECRERCVDCGIILCFQCAVALEGLPTVPHCPICERKADYLLQSEQEKWRRYVAIHKKLEASIANLRKAVSEQERYEKEGYIGRLQRMKAFYRSNLGV